MTVAITETMEQVQKHIEKYLALHPEITDNLTLMHEAIRERWGDVDSAALLEEAELNSLAAARRKIWSDPRKNPWVDTTAQGDLFDSVLVKVPSMLIIKGRPTPYYEASIVDGLEWWLARQDAKKDEADALREAAEKRDRESAEAARQAETLERLVRTALDNGVDPRTVLYAKAQA